MEMDIHVDPDPDPNLDSPRRKAELNELTQDSVTVCKINANVCPKTPMKDSATATPSRKRQEPKHSQLPYRLAYQNPMFRLNPYCYFPMLDDGEFKMLAFIRGRPTATARGGGFRAFHHGRGNGTFDCCTGHTNPDLFFRVKVEFNRVRRLRYWKHALVGQRREPPKTKLLPDGGSIIDPGGGAFRKIPRLYKDGCRDGGGRKEKMDTGGAGDDDAEWDWDNIPPGNAEIGDWY